MLSPLLGTPCFSSLLASAWMQVRYLPFQGALHDCYQSGLGLLCPFTAPVSASVSALTAAGVPSILLIFPSAHGEERATSQAPPCRTTAEAREHFGPHLTGILYLLLPMGVGGQSDWSNLGPHFIGEQGPDLKGNLSVTG